MGSQAAMNPTSAGQSIDVASSGLASRRVTCANWTRRVAPPEPDTDLGSVANVGADCAGEAWCGEGAFGAGVNERSDPRWVVVAGDRWSEESDLEDRSEDDVVWVVDA
jgi:hypothetical protein